MYFIFLQGKTLHYYVHPYFLSRVHKLRKMDVETKTETKIGSENNTERFRYMCFLFCQEIVFIMLYQTCWNTMHPFV